MVKPERRSRLAGKKHKKNQNGKVHVVQGKKSIDQNGKTRKKVACGEETQKNQNGKRKKLVRLRRMEIFASV